MEITRYTGRMTDYLLEHFGTAALIGAELGVYQGQGALRILNTVNMKELWLVDPYEYYEEYRDYNADLIKEAFHVAKSRLAPHSARVRWMFLTATAAAAVFADMKRLLDFAYLDHNHFAQFVYPDIWNYAAVVRPGGVVGGHDFAHNKKSEGICKVQEAVLYFAEETGIQIVTQGKDPDFQEDWWFIVTDELHKRAIETYGTHEWREI